jgi:hypothetical protein
LTDSPIGRGFTVPQQCRDQGELHGWGDVGTAEVLFCCCDDLFEPIQGRIQIAGV